MAHNPHDPSHTGQQQLSTRVVSEDSIEKRQDNSATLANVAQAQQTLNQMLGRACTPPPQNNKS